MRITKEITVMTATEVNEGSSQKSPNWNTYITANVQRRVIPSDTQAQKIRPTELPMLTIPTMPAAMAALAAVNFWKIGDSWEMSEIPAEVFRKSKSQSTHHCQVASAVPSVKSSFARCAVCVALGVQPFGPHPAGGFFINSPATTTTIMYAT